MKYRPQSSEPDINLAPMIDVVFLLLIFFIVASTLNINEVKTKISLPETEVVEQTGNTDIVIMITEEKELYLNKKKVKLGNLYDQLAQIMVDKKCPVSIYADKKIDYQHIIRVMDIVKKLNVKELSFSLLKK